MNPVSPRVVATAIAGCVFLGLVCAAIKWAFTKGEEHLGSLWAAGAVSARSENDIWIEYVGPRGEVGAVYRDYDGDGIVDECLMFAGPYIAVYRSTKKDGILDMTHYIDQPLGSVERLPPGAPESGPFTRDKLDALARLHPRHTELPFSNRIGKRDRPN